MILAACSADIMSDACLVSCATAVQHCCCCFRLVTRLLPPVTYGETNPDAFFGYDFMQNWVPHFGWRPTPKRYPKMDA